MDDILNSLKFNSIKGSTDLNSIINNFPAEI